MTERAFHDAILKNGSIPVALARACLNDVALDKEEPPRWRFAEVDE
jgi:hypothetical protein